MTHWSYWRTARWPHLCVGINIMDTGTCRMGRIECQDRNKARRFRIIPDGRIEMNEPADWGLYFETRNLKGQELASITDLQHWTLVRNHGQGQTLTFMLKNHGIPNPSEPEFLCSRNGSPQTCTYENEKNILLVPWCPAAFPHIGM